MFDYYFYFLPWLWSALELLDRALYKSSFIIIIIIIIIITIIIIIIIIIYKRLNMQLISHQLCNSKIILNIESMFRHTSTQKASHA